MPAVQRLCGRGPPLSLPSLSRGRSTFALAPSAAAGPLSALGTCGGSRCLCEGWGLPPRPRWGRVGTGVPGSSAILCAEPPGSDCPEQGRWGPLSLLCAAQSCGGSPWAAALLDVGRLPWLGHLGALVTVTMTWRARGRRALAGLPGSVPLSRRHSRCRVSPARGCQPGQGSAVPCRASVSSEPAAAVPAGHVVLAAGPAWHCPARRGVLRWHRSQSCSGGTGSPPTPPERTGAVTMGKQRHEAAREGGGKSCRRPRRQWEPPARVEPCAFGGFWSAVGV